MANFNSLINHLCCSGPRLGCPFIAGAQLVGRKTVESASSAARKIPTALFYRLVATFLK